LDHNPVASCTSNGIPSLLFPLCLLAKEKGIPKYEKSKCAGGSTTLDGWSLKKLAMILGLILLVWTSASLVSPAFSHAAEVRNVIPRDADGATHLNITVWHDIESSLHYVDTIEVTWGTNVTSLTIGPKPLAPDGTFNIDYSMGSVSGTPTISVRARCTITGYSGSLPWTGQIPEFPSLVFLPIFIIVTLMAIILLKKWQTL